MYLLNRVFLSVCKYRITYPRNATLLKNDPTLRGPPGAACSALSLFINNPNSVEPIIYHINVFLKRIAREVIRHICTF